MLDLPDDILFETGLVLGQHLQHQTQVQPPLLLGHPVPVGACRGAAVTGPDMLTLVCERVLSCVTVKPNEPLKIRPVVHS